jgi:hypothetical protein
MPLYFSEQADQVSNCARQEDRRYRFAPAKQCLAGHAQPEHAPGTKLRQSGARVSRLAVARWQSQGWRSLQHEPFVSRNPGTRLFLFS